MSGRIRTNQAMYIICLLYRMISSSSKGAMSSLDDILLLKSGSGEFCFLLYGYVLTSAALNPDCDTKKQNSEIFWMLSPRNETELSYVSCAHFKGGNLRLPSSTWRSLSWIVLDPDFAHHECRKLSMNTSTMDIAGILLSRSRSIRLQMVVSFGL